MAAHASDVRWTTGAVLMAMVLAGLAGCKTGHRIAPTLPRVQKVELWKPGQGLNDQGGNVRTEQGQAIAPTVIEDDPAPSVAPGASGQPASRASLNGDPNGITRESLNRVIQGAMGSLAACFSNITQDPMVAVSFEADPSGRPSLVRVNGAPPDAEHCIRNVVQGIRFPSFEGKGVQVDLPLSFHRAARAPQPSGEQQAQGVATPPLFLEP